MPRPRSVAGGRPVTVTIKLSTAEATALDGARAGLSRSAYVRRMLFGPPTPRPSDAPDPYQFAP